MAEAQVRELERYIYQVLHTPVHLRPWPNQKMVPYFLDNRYEFFEGRLMGRPVLFLFGINNIAARIALKHGRAIGEYWRHPVVFVFKRMTADVRHRFVQLGLPFVVPRQQLYLPMVGASMRERFTAPALGVDRLSPSTQVALLFTLLNPDRSADTATKLARETGFTPMAMVRAINQLEATGLIRTARVGRERSFQFAAEPAQTWIDAQGVLHTPVKRRLRFADCKEDSLGPGIASGLSGLALCSSLAPGPMHTLAMSLDEFRKNAVYQGLPTVDSAEEADLEIEIWNYPPQVLAEGDLADPLSLYLDLRQEADERVQAALEEMMESVRW